MTEYMGFSRENEHAAVMMFIQQAKIEKMPAEFVQNGIEHNATRVHLSSEMYGRLGSKSQKLVITNNGDGMTPQEMRNHLMNMCSSSKETSVDGNRGMGARITGLRASPAGMIYTSGIKGNPIQVLRLWIADGRVCMETSETSVIADQDFVKTTLIGETSASNTVVKPYEGCRGVAGIAADLMSTYYRFPKGFQVTVDRELLSGRGSSISTIGRSWAGATTTTTSSCRRFKLHWIDAGSLHKKDSTLYRVDGIVPAVTMRSGLVYQDRLFSVYSGKNEWRHASQKFGLELVYEGVFVFVELLDKYPVAPTTNRDQLMYTQSMPGRRASTDASLIDFAKVSKTMRPAWVQRRIDEAREALTKPIDVRDQMREIAEIFDLRRNAKKIDEEGETEVSDELEDGDTIRQPETDEPVTPNPNPNKNPSPGTGKRASVIERLLNHEPHFRVIYPGEPLHADLEGKTMAVRDGTGEDDSDCYIDGANVVIAKFAERIADIAKLDPEDSLYRIHFEKQVSIVAATPYWMSVLVPYYKREKSVDGFVEYMQGGDHFGMTAVFTSLLLRDSSLRSIADEIVKGVGAESPESKAA